MVKPIRAFYVKNEKMHMQAPTAKARGNDVADGIPFKGYYVYADRMILRGMKIEELRGLSVCIVFSETERFEGTLNPVGPLFYGPGRTQDFITVYEDIMLAVDIK